MHLQVGTSVRPDQWSLVGLAAQGIVAFDQGTLKIGLLINRTTLNMVFLIQLVYKK